MCKQEFKKYDILKKLNELYSLSSSIEYKRDIIEITPPLYLDDCNQLTLFIIKRDQKTEISTNLVKELEKSIIKKLATNQIKICDYLKEVTDEKYKNYEELEYNTNKKHITKVNIIKKYLENKNEFKELKKTLKEFGIDSNSYSLKYLIKDEKNLISEIGAYSEVVKIYYNNIYHLLVERLASSNEKSNIFYKNFSKIFKEMKDLTFKEYKTKKYSTSPIYYDEKNVVTIAKDLDGLAKLYLDIKKIKSIETKMDKGILYFEEPKTSKSKFNDILKEFEEMNLYIKKLESSDEKYLETIVLEDLKDIFNGNTF